MKNRDDSELVPLDDRTHRRLDRLSKITGDSIGVLAAKLLRDILEEDESAHKTKH